jgi:uncharacterized membrane protein
MTKDKLEFCDCLTTDERIDIQDAILFAQSHIINNEEKLEQEKLSNKISKEVYDYMKKDNIRRSKIFGELHIKIENTPRCKQ